MALSSSTKAKLLALIAGLLLAPPLSGPLSADEAPDLLAQALSKEVEYDLLKRRLIRYVKAGDHKNTLKTIANMRSVGVPVSPSLDYLEGKALLRVGQAADAVRLLSRYVSTVGRKGAFYTRALDLLVEARDAKAKQEKLRAAAARRRAKAAAAAARVAAAKRAAIGKTQLAEKRKRALDTRFLASIKPSDLAARISDRVNWQVRHPHSKSNPITKLSDTSSISFSDQCIVRIYRRYTKSDTSMRRPRMESRQMSGTVNAASIYITSRFGRCNGNKLYEDPHESWPPNTRCELYLSHCRNRNTKIKCKDLNKNWIQYELKTRKYHPRRERMVNRRKLRRSWSVSLYFKKGVAEDLYRKLNNLKRYCQIKNRR